jgi:hypothetical protein
MRTVSAAEAKGRGHHHDLPSPGTKLRAVLDLFYPPLTVVPLRAIREIANGRRLPGHYIADLKNFYGLDIRRHHYGHWWLVGEYFPGGYLDYADESYKEL